MIKDRLRWRQWLFEAKRRYGLVILNYAVTSNHIHLLVLDVKGRDVIPQSIKLIVGRTAQEYNTRKKVTSGSGQARYVISKVLPLKTGIIMGYIAVFVPINSNIAFYGKLTDGKSEKTLYSRSDMAYNPSLP